MANEDRWILGFKIIIGSVKLAVDANCHIKVRLDLRRVGLVVRRWSANVSAMSHSIFSPSCTYLCFLWALPILEC